MDHVLGSPDAAVMLVWYGDFECPHCLPAADVVRTLRARFGPDLAITYRYLPLTDIHPRAQAAAEAAAAAAAQGRFWEMWAALYEHQDDLRDERILALAGTVGLDTDRFTAELHRRRHALRVARDVASADDSGAVGTPTFFLNGRRLDGRIDADTMTRAVRDAVTAPGSRKSA